MFIDIYWNKKYIHVRFITQILFKRPSETKKIREIMDRRIYFHLK